MKIKILNKIWELVFFSNLKNRGECDHPCSVNKQIRVRENLEGEEKLEILIHEMLHAAFWHLDEEYVQAAAEDIAKVLWKLGYKDD
jgi:hypothetical protein